MYGYHPLFNRHLMHEYAVEREALRQLGRPASDDDEPTRSETTIPRWFAALAVVVVGLAFLMALVLGPSTTDESAKRFDPTPTCQPGGGVKVQTFAPCTTIS